MNNTQYNTFLAIKNFIIWGRKLIYYNLNTVVFVIDCSNHVFIHIFSCALCSVLLKHILFLHLPIWLYFHPYQLVSYVILFINCIDRLQEQTVFVLIQFCIFHQYLLIVFWGILLKYATWSVMVPLQAEEMKWSSKLNWLEWCVCKKLVQCLPMFLHCWSGLQVHSQRQTNVWFNLFFASNQ